MDFPGKCLVSNAGSGWVIQRKLQKSDGGQMWCSLCHYIHVSGLGSSCEHATGEFIQNVLVSALGFEEDR